MKSFFEVLLTAATFILFAFGQIGLATFAGTFAVILWMAPAYTGKSVEEIIAEANGEGTDTVSVEYHFIPDPSEKFTADLHHYSNGKILEEAILPKLASYITEHTGIPTDAGRLHITKIQVQ